MVNTDYRIEAIAVLLNENCILKGYYPLIPYKKILVEFLRQRGCVRKSDIGQCTDQQLLQAGLPDMAHVCLFRKFLNMYDPKAQKMREVDTVSKTPEEAEALRELYLLPGVKCTRAKLYWKAGVFTLNAIAGLHAEELVAACQKAIADGQLTEKPPLLKEARTHIAVAKAFTDTVDETER